LASVEALGVGFETVGIVCEALGIAWDAFAIADGAFASARFFGVPHDTQAKTSNGSSKMRRFMLFSFQSLGRIYVRLLRAA
jgi:hypothetical protein